MIEKEIPQDALGNRRKSVMKNLTLTKDIEFELEIEIHELDSDGNSQFEKVKNVTGITEDQRQTLLRKYFPITPENKYKTKDSRVDSATGEISDNGDMTEIDALFAFIYQCIKADNSLNPVAAVRQILANIVETKMLKISEDGRN